MIFKKKKGNTYCENCEHKSNFSESLCTPPIKIDDYFSKKHALSRFCRALNKNNNCKYFKKSKGYW